MRVIETTGRTPEEAVEIALKELDADREEVEIDVVSRGKSGILGIGSEPARVRVTLLDKRPDIVKVTSEILDSLITRMGVDVRASLKQAHRDDLGGPVFEIVGDDSGLLIGRKGETLRALQFLVKFLASRKLALSGNEGQANLLVDVEGYQDRRYRALRNLANKVADRVASSGRAITLEPMPPNERRVVHMTLADHSSVVTESVGMGESRQVVVKPKGS